MQITTKHITIILIIAIILAILITFIMKITNPIIIGLAILAIIVILANFYLLNVKKR